MSRGAAARTLVVLIGAAVSAYNIMDALFDVASEQDFRAAAQKVAVWFVVFAVAVAVQIGFLLHENYRLRSVPKNQLRIVFHGEQRPYVQELDVEMNVKGTKVRCLDRRYRVGVQASGAGPIPDCRVVVESCAPADAFFFPDHELQVMDTSPPTGRFTAHPDAKPRTFVDVAHTLLPLSGPDIPGIALCYARADSGLANLLQQSERFTITLRAEGGGASIHRAFILEKRPGQKLTMHPAHFQLS